MLESDLGIDIDPPAGGAPRAGPKYLPPSKLSIIPPIGIGNPLGPTLATAIIYKYVIAPATQRAPNIMYAIVTGSTTLLLEDFLMLV